MNFDIQGYFYYAHNVIADELTKRVKADPSLLNKYYYNIRLQIVYLGSAILFFRCHCA